jgi:hypothetical protein
MSKLDIIGQLAREVLVVKAPAGGFDYSLWDRAQRLVRNIEHISLLPELLEARPNMDCLCLSIAAYFCDTGFAQSANSRDSNKTDILPEGPAELVEVINTEELRRLSIRIVTERLGSILTTPQINKVNTIIIQSGDRFTNMTEAMILSDARNLEDMGLIGVFKEFRRCMLQGKAVTDTLQNWKRKIDYRYWQARLKESFQFKTVQSIAAKRFAAAESFMRQLSIENTAWDLEESGL